MKTIVRNRKYVSKDNSTVFSMDIKELPENIFDQVMKLIVENLPADIQLVDETKVGSFTYKPQQCKMTGVHLTRRQDETGLCAFCGLAE